MNRRMDLMSCKGNGETEEDGVVNYDWYLWISITVRTFGTRGTLHYTHQNLLATAAFSPFHHITTTSVGAS